jgi:hypothetical protein
MKRWSISSGTCDHGGLGEYHATQPATAGDTPRDAGCGSNHDFSELSIEQFPMLLCNISHFARQSEQ